MIDLLWGKPEQLRKWPMKNLSWKNRRGWSFRRKSGRSLIRDIGVLAVVIATAAKDAKYMVAIVYDLLPLCPMRLG
jgi:hypothetical protein